MPKVMAPEKCLKVEEVKKQVGGHEYRDPHTKQRNPNFNPGWYYFSYRPLKYGPFTNQEAALLAGIENTISKRTIKV